MQVMNIKIYGLKSVVAKAATAATVPTPLPGKNLKGQIDIYTVIHAIKMISGTHCFVHALNRHGIPWRPCSYVYVRILVTS